MNDTETKASEYLIKKYETAMRKASGHSNPQTVIEAAQAEFASVIVENSEASKAALAVTLTCLTYKILTPQQDIRNHQQSIPGGFSGRTFDSHVITPFLRRQSFPCMAESGWLTRSFEHKEPYSMAYKGAIKPQKLKTAFLSLIDSVQTKNSKRENESLLSYVLELLIIARDSKSIRPAIPRNLSIAATASLLDSHFHAKYKAPGAARLPVLAIYAIYKCLFNEGLKRFQGKLLLPLESHNSADAQSGRIGDIDIANADGSAFESVEVKLDVKISADIVDRAKEKVLRSTASRYYILSTLPTEAEEAAYIESTARNLATIHGCQLIVNGVLPTIKYYLRLLGTPAAFVEEYANLVFADESIKYEHRENWNRLISSREP